MKQVTFIDYACIKVKGGNGGNGAKAFHREKYVDRGGPSGGDGGNGGSVIFVADNNENTLLDFKSRKHYDAENGTNGSAKNMTGATGEDLLIRVPVGTQIIENGKEVVDLSFNGQKWMASQGGKGGRGNSSFKSSRNLAPELHEHGEKVTHRELCLNLKVLADVGLLGYPNAGKSTFVSVVSNAKPKIADYPFTTLIPKLGLVKHNDTKFIVTDLPGIIDGASEGKGMGHQFLKHLSRTKLILHLIDSTNEDIKQMYLNLRKELELYSTELSNLKEVIVITKIDMVDKDQLKEIKTLFKDKTVFFLSSLTQEGLKELLDTTTNVIEEIRKKEIEDANTLVKDDEYVVITHEKDNDELSIEVEGNIFTIHSKYVEYWANRIPLNNHDNLLRIMAKFKSHGILEKLKKKGFKEGCFLKVKNTAFLYEYEL